MNQHHSNHSAGIIGGVAAGAAVAGVIVLAVVIYLLRRRFPRIRLTEDTELRRANMIDPLSITPFRLSTVVAAPATSSTSASIYGAQPYPARSNTTSVKSTETSIPGRSNTITTLQPRVSMSLYVPSQQGSSSSRSQTLVESSSTSSTQKRDVVTVANTSTSSSRKRTTSLLSEHAEQNIVSRPASQRTSANEITPMLEDNEEIDDNDEDYEAPPPTYTSRADNGVNSERLQHYLVRQSR